MELKGLVTEPQQKVCIPDRGTMIGVIGEDPDSDKCPLHEFLG